MGSSYLFLFHVTLVGFALAVASHYFGRLMGTSGARVLPGVDGDGGFGAALLLWLLSGPVALVRVAERGLSRHVLMLAPAALAVGFALLWAFCLGVVTLELCFRLLHG